MTHGFNVGDTLSNRFNLRGCFSEGRDRVDRNLRFQPLRGPGSQEIHPVWINHIDYCATQTTQGP